MEEETLLRVLLLDFARKLWEWVLQAVIHLREDAGAEFGGEQVAGELHAVVDHQLRGGLEHLHVATRATHADDLRHQPFLAEHGVAHFILCDGAVECDGDHVAVDGDDFSCCLHVLYSFRTDSGAGAAVSRLKTSLPTSVTRAVRRMEIASRIA